MRFGVAVGSVLAGAVALAGALAIPSGAQAALQKLTVDLNDYSTSAVNSPGGETLATMTVTDLSGGGVSVSFALDAPAQYFASTGGSHITAAFNLDTTITAADITDTTPSSPGFAFVIPTGNVPGGPGHFGTFTAGLQGDWNGTSNHFAGPITFDISGVSVADFVVNSAGYYAVADVLGNKGTGDIGGKIGTVVTTTIVGTPEPSTWAMLLIGFAGLGFAGYRKSRGGRIARSVA